MSATQRPEPEREPEHAQTVHSWARMKLRTMGVAAYSADFYSWRPPIEPPPRRRRRRRR